MSSVEVVQGLKVVDAYDLHDDLRAILKPGDMVRDAEGRRHRLPRYFYEIPSHDVGMSTRLTPHFGLNEFIVCDLKEASRLHGYPRYVPCAIRILAFYLEQFREKCGASVHIAVNGGYRSPSHKLSINGSAHMWGTAADIYRIGTNILKTKEAIEKYNDIAEDLSEEVNVLPYGHVTGRDADDHVHIDLGYMTLIPREISEDRMEQPQENRPRFAFEERRRKDRRGAAEPEDPS
ncbi:MAG: D-Ala-D-Ala carboxypeptidase family metallohydrolase [Thermoanaerobaculia bacterium]